ncbi:hypothetical protein [Solicola sp. PLA-1-18]|uniref:hypothetical protein n=1 Tax=Solicola sp. PLA-1-18 TaxID=3380532 RepID=UPI003B79F5AF
MTTTPYTENASGATPGGPSGDGSSDAKQKAQQAANEAADQAQHVGGVAKDQASQVADEAKQHAKGLLDDATSQVDDQARTQLGRLSETLRSVGGDLDDMAAGSDRDGVARTLAQEVATRARTLGEHLDGREPRDLLDDVRAYARRRPGTFLLGAVVAGVVAGRLTRGAKAGSDASGASSTSATQRPVTPVDPSGTGTTASTSYGDPSTGLREPGLDGLGSPAGTTPDLDGLR